MLEKIQISEFQCFETYVDEGFPIDEETEEFPSSKIIPSIFLSEPGCIFDPIRF